MIKCFINKGGKMSSQAISCSRKTDKQLVIRRAPEKGDKPCRGMSQFVNCAMLLEVIKYAELTTAADAKVLHFVSSFQIPCHWEPKIQAIVPNFKSPYKLLGIWTRFRNQIRNEIGPIHPTRTKAGSFFWNSARSIEELCTDEQEGSTTFKRICKKIEMHSKGKPHFGPNNSSITKSQSSIMSKVQRMQFDCGCSMEEAIRKIDDGVRGTISFSSPAQLKEGIKSFIEFAKKRSLGFECSNMWEENSECAGYLDVDFKILIPLKEKRQVVAELQFHLDSFYDGTSVSPVSRAHKIYEEMRMMPVTRKSNVNLYYAELHETSRLYFAAALFVEKCFKSQ